MNRISDQSSLEAMNVLARAERRREMQNIVESEAYYSITEQPYIAQVDKNFVSIHTDGEERKIRMERIGNIQQIQLTVAEQQQIINNIILSDSDASAEPSAVQLRKRLQQM